MNLENAEKWARDGLHNSWEVTPMFAMQMNVVVDNALSCSSELLKKKLPQIFYDIIIKIS